MTTMTQMNGKLPPIILPSKTSKMSKEVNPQTIRAQNHSQAFNH